MSLRPSVALLVLLNTPWFAQAQSALPSPDPAADSVVITASRSPEAAGNTARPLQLISADEIRSSGAGSLLDVLRTLGGVEVSSSGGMGQPLSVFMRGANSNQTVVLVDGVRISSPTLGTAPLESLPLALIDHIEILPGPSSSLYGADAIGGVIQIFTRSAERSPGATVSLTAGQQGLGQLAGAWAAREGNTDLSLGAQVMSTRGYNITTPANTYSYNPDADGDRNHSLNLRLTQHLSATQQLDLQWLNSSGRIHFDDGAGNSYNDNQTQTLTGHWAGALTPTLQSELRLARAWDNSTTTSSNYPGVTNSVQDEASWLNHLRLAGGSLSAGLEWLQQNVSSDTAYSQTSRHIAGALAGWRAQYGALALQADLRHDQNSQFGGHTTAQLATAWQVDPQWRLRASAGNAFKAPTLNDLYYTDAYGDRGNPALQPELSNNVEVGADWHGAAVDLHATVFDNHLRQLIEWVENPVGSYTYQPVNLARAENLGTTWSAAARLDPATQLAVNLTFQNPKDSTTGAPLQRRAKAFGGLHLSHRSGAWQVGTDLSWVGARYDSSTAIAATRMGGYGLAAVFARWQFAPAWSLEGRIDNLVDKHYTVAQGYVPPGRLGQMTLRWTPQR